ncbi:MAG: efflux RND transporter permease subunit [Rubrivivax sp.]|nr:efflux RND transporter permease subunit [Rubrivivax sp.]
MWFTRVSIANPVMAVMVMLAFVVLGLFSYQRLSLDQFPNVDLPTVVVSIDYPGASPEIVEAEVTKKVEEAVNTVAGISSLYSRSYESSSVVIIEFNLDIDGRKAADDVREKVALIRPLLRDEVKEPRISRFDPAAQPVFNVAVLATDATTSPQELTTWARQVLQKRLENVRGVGAVSVIGGVDRQINVYLRAQAMEALGVTTEQVAAALKSENQELPLGSIRSREQDRVLQINARLKTPREFRDIVVARKALPVAAGSGSASVVKLWQVADVVDGPQELESLALYNGQRTVLLSVQKSQGENTIALVAGLRRALAEAQAVRPSNMRTEINRDNSRAIRVSVANVQRTLLEGAGLTILIVFLFLNSWRSTVITGLTLPIALIGTFGFMYAFGFTINTVTLMALSLCVGLLIDDAIVVRENIVRHMEAGEDRRTAALNGTAEIGLAVAATTFSIVAVFVPVAFMPGVSGEWFRPFGLTVVASVLVSLFISFTLDPMLSAYWGDPPGHHQQPKTGISRQLARFNAWFDHQADRYGRVIAWALHHRRWMAAFAVLSLVAAIGLQMRFGGSSFLPASDFGTIAIDVRTPSSSSLEYARLKVEAAATLARTLPETKATNSFVNPGGGRIYVDIGKSTQRKRSSQLIGADLRKLTARLVGAEYVVLDDLNNGAQKPVQIRFTGADTRQLLEITSAFMDKLRTVPGAVDVGLSEQDPQDEMKIELDRGLANTLGISVNDAAQALRVAFAGVEVGDWVDPGGETRDVAVRLHPDDRVSAGNIERLPIAVSGSNRMVPLEQIATVTMGKGPSQIQHNDGKRTISVAANVQGRSPGEVTADALKLARAMDYPPGYGLELAGASRDQQEVFKQMGIALVSGIALMYLVLVMQFGSFTAPLAVMLSLPLSLIGVVAALLLTGGTLNLMSFIGVIMLMGLVAKNAILLLDAARVQEALGVDREEALMAAGRKRLRPILMTTFALVAGMMPVAIGVGEGGEFYRPMAVAIIGGVITSTLLTLLVIPSFYDSIETARDHMSAKFQRRELRWNTFVAVSLTGLEVVAALTGLRLLWRGMLRSVGWVRRRATGGGAQPA